MQRLNEDTFEDLFPANDMKMFNGFATTSKMTEFDN